MEQRGLHEGHAMAFDSHSGAAGQTSDIADQEYGAQDFFGLIEEMRVWNIVRTPEEIRKGMEMDDGRGRLCVDAQGIAIVCEW